MCVCVCVFVCAVRACVRACVRECVCVCVCVYARASVTVSVFLCLRMDARDVCTSVSMVCRILSLCARAVSLSGYSCLRGVSWVHHVRAAPPSGVHHLSVSLLHGTQPLRLLRQPHRPGA